MIDLGSRHVLAGLTNGNIRALCGLLMSNDLGQSLREVSRLQLGPPKAAAAQDAADAAFEQETVDALCRTVAALPGLLVVRVWGLSARQAEAVAAAGQQLDLQPMDAQCLHLACQSE